MQVVGTKQSKYNWKEIDWRMSDEGVAEQTGAPVNYVQLYRRRHGLMTGYKKRIALKAAVVRSNSISAVDTEDLFKEILRRYKGQSIVHFIDCKNSTVTSTWPGLMVK